MPSKTDEKFRAWYQERYGVEFGREGSIRLMPMDLREAWIAGGRIDDASRLLLLKALTHAANHTHVNDELEYLALIGALGLEEPEASG